MSHLIFDKVPADLLSIMVEFQPMVQKFEAKHGPNNPQVIFYKRMLEIMRKSLIHMNDVEFIYRQNQMLTSDNELLTERLTTIEKRLAIYEGIRDSINTGVFADVVERVKKRMDDIPNDSSFLDGSEATPNDVMTSYRRYQINKSIDNINP